MLESDWKGIFGPYYCLIIISSSSHLNIDTKTITIELTLIFKVWFKEEIE
jgi:hypothetical protein